jgi:hypothetical protein
VYPFTITETSHDPELTPDGTIAFIWVLLKEEIDALRLPNFTLTLLLIPNPIPVIVTEVPPVPLKGLMDVSVGASKVKSVGD